LIEEVIQVAEGELKLVDTLLKAKVYVFPLFISESIANGPLQMGGSGGEASRRAMDILHARH
jgi:hypothetical protein